MSNITMLDLVLGALLAAAILAIVILLVTAGRLARRVAGFPRREAEIRSDARRRSRIVQMASISEQLAPLLPGFRYNPKDVQWIGGGGAVDAIVWNGLEAGGEVEIVFLDVKAGPRAHLTGNQRRIREAIAWKRIAFDEYRPPAPPPLMAAVPPELPGDGPVTVPGDQVAEETDRQAGEVLAADMPGVPVPQAAGLIADVQLGSEPS